MAQAQRGTDASTVLGVAAARFVRASNIAIGVAGAAVLVADLLEPSLGGQGSWVLRAAAGTVTAAAVVASRVDVDRAVRTGQGRAVIRWFPLVVAVTAALASPMVGQGSVLSLGLVLAIVVAALTSTAAIAMATLVVQVLGELAAAAAAASPDLGWTAATLVVGSALWWAGRSAVTGLEDLIEAQAEARRRAEQLAAARHDFVATVSHELRTPTTIVAGLAEVLDVRWAALPPPERRELVARLRVGGDELRELVDVLLDFGRLGDEGVRLAASPFALEPIASDVVRAASAIHPDHRVVLDSELGRRQAMGDPVLVGRVVDNLVRNACSHTPPGTTVSVTASHAGHDLELRVTDDGPGIEPDDIPRLTERYFRGGDHLNRSSRGLGLGLAFCAEVLELHGRQLEVESTPGEGATFAFRLPAAPSPGRQGRDRAVVGVDD